MWSPRRADPRRDGLRALGLHVREVEHAQDHLLRGELLEDRGVEARLRRLDRDLFRRCRIELGEEGVAVRLLVDDRRVAEAGVERERGAGDAFERALDRLECVLPRVLGAGLQVGLVDLHDVGSRGDEIAQFLVHRLRVCQRERPEILVVVVLRLLAHRERPRDGDADRPLGQTAQELRVAHLHRPGPPDPPHHARHRVRVPRPIERCSGLVEVEAVERVRKAVRVALAPNLAVGDDVDSGFFHVADGQPGGVVLCLDEPLLVDPPELARRNARRQPTGQLLAID
jgi:hypothetical protein